MGGPGLETPGALLGTCIQPHASLVRPAGRGERCAAGEAEGRRAGKRPLVQFLIRGPRVSRLEGEAERSHSAGPTYPLSPSCTRSRRVSQCVSVHLSIVVATWSQIYRLPQKREPGVICSDGQSISWDMLRLSFVRSDSLYISLRQLADLPTCALISHQECDGSTMVCDLSDDTTNFAPFSSHTLSLMCPKAARNLLRRVLAPAPPSPPAPCPVAAAAAACPYRP